MAPDPDGTSARLFAAARRERPLPLARDRALRAAARELHGHALRDKGWRYAAPVGVLGAMAAGAMLLLSAASSSDDALEIQRDDAAVAQVPAALEETPSASAEQMPDVPPVVSSDQAPPLSTSSRPKNERPTRLVLADEIAILNEARTSLEDADGRRALELLERHKSRTGGGRLGEEAALLRMEALVRLGRQAEAKRVADDFLRKHPGSTLSDRARRFTEPTNSPETAPNKEPGKEPHKLDGENQP